MNKAIIGGTGVYDVYEKTVSKEVQTEYGTVTVDIVTIDGQEIVFLPRHGKGHSSPPHQINYRANIACLKSLGIEYIYSTAAVGSCNPKYKVGDVVLIKDFLDFTKSRPLTFFESGKKVSHAIMDDPYCSYLRNLFMENAGDLSIEGEAVYVCTEGPRFETAAEIRAFIALGGDVVGMTTVPEVVLAKELGMCYSVVGVITNMCTGICDDIEKHEIISSMNKNKAKITETFLKVFKKDLTQNACHCKNSIIEL